MLAKTIIAMTACAYTPVCDRFERVLGNRRGGAPFVAGGEGAAASVGFVVTSGEYVFDSSDEYVIAEWRHDRSATGAHLHSQRSPDGGLYLCGPDGAIALMELADLARVTFVSDTKHPQERKLISTDTDALEHYGTNLHFSSRANLDARLAKAEEA